MSGGKKYIATNNSESVSARQPRVSSIRFVGQVMKSGKNHPVTGRSKQQPGMKFYTGSGALFCLCCADDAVAF